MKICFIMYPWDRIEAATDTTLRLIHEAVLRGHTVAIACPNNLTIRDSVASAFCDLIVKSTKVTEDVPRFHKQAKFRRVQLPLSGFDVIFMRANPPLNPITLNFLDSVRNDTFIINDITGLRLANNKLYTASLYNPSHDFVPATHVSRNRDYLERIFRECEQSKMILKPLTGYGGQGVIVIEKSAQQSFRSLLDYYINADASGRGNYVILQEYVEGADQGDVRILMLNGEPIGAMKRIPDASDVRSNVHAGGTVKKHVLSKEEKSLCKYIGPKLVQDGLYFVGIDVINGKLIEVNVLSPGGITRINRLNRVKLQRQVIDFVETLTRTRDMLAERKSALRKVIEDVEVE